MTVLRVWRRWRSSVAAVAILGALAAALWATQRTLPADDDTKSSLPSDLAKIPSDATIVASFAIGELWKGDLLKDVRGKHKELEEANRDFEKHFGLPLDQVERLSIVLLDPPPPPSEPLLFVRTTKPYNLEKIVAIGNNLKQVKYKDETLYAAPQSRCIFPIDDRTLVFGTSASDLHSLIDHPRPREKGALAGVLDRAAEKHSVVVGINVKQLFVNVQDQLPGEVEPFKPLLAARRATLLFDSGAEARLTTALRFETEKEAQAAMEPAKNGLALLQGAMGQAIKTLDADKEMEGIVGLLKQLEPAVKAAQVERKDETLNLSVGAKVDLPSAGVVLVQAVQRVRGAAARAQSSNNLKQIALAMHNYHDVNGNLPPQATYDKNGKPMLSWRVMILPYLEQQNLYNQFHLDEAWDSEHNKKLLERMPLLYASPQDPKNVKEHTTHYQGFVGKGAFFEGKKGLRFADFTDGTSNTIMIVEAANAVPWSKPEDLPYDAAKPLPKLGLPGANGFQASTCDGAVRFISSKLKTETLRNAITRNDGNVLGPDF